MNEHVRNNYFFSSVKVFKERIDDFFQITLPNIADSLNSRINDNFQRFDLRWVYINKGIKKKEY